MTAEEFRNAIRSNVYSPEGGEITDRDYLDEIAGKVDSGEYIAEEIGQQDDIPADFQIDRKVILVTPLDRQGLRQPLQEFVLLAD